MAARQIIEAYAPEIASFLEKYYNEFLAFIGDEKDTNRIIISFKELDKEGSNDNAR